MRYFFYLKHPKTNRNEIKTSKYRKSVGAERFPADRWKPVSGAFVQWRLPEWKSDAEAPRQSRHCARPAGYGPPPRLFQTSSRSVLPTSSLYLRPNRAALQKGRHIIQLFLRNPTSELRDVTCHMGSHSVTCHPTQVNAPRLTPANTIQYKNL